jgi:voltage-gated sodium channel
MRKVQIMDDNGRGPRVTAQASPRTLAAFQLQLASLSELAAKCCEGAHVFEDELRLLRTENEMLRSKLTNGDCDDKHETTDLSTHELGIPHLRGKGAWGPSSPDLPGKPTYIHPPLPLTEGSVMEVEEYVQKDDQYEQKMWRSTVNTLRTVNTEDAKTEKARQAVKDGVRAMTREAKTLVNDDPIPKREQGLFVDEAKLKENIRKGLLTSSDQAVEDLYKTEGLAQRIARHDRFEKTTIAVVIINAAWMTVDTDLNQEAVLYEASPMFVIAENIFCLYFTVELLIRFIAFFRKADCVKDQWFVFDLGLVIFMIMETWLLAPIVYYLKKTSGGGSGPSLELLTPLKLLRLLRMARMAKLMRAMPELLILIKAIVIATRTVFFTLILLVMIVYVFAIFFTSQLGPDSDLADHDDCKFGTVADSFVTLLIASAFPDLAGIFLALKEESVALFFVFMLFVLISGLTVMNMLIGILCEIISCISAAEKEELQVGQLKADLQSLFDWSQDHEISKDEFLDLLLKPRACQAMATVGVDVVGLVDYMDFIFNENESLVFPDFMNAVLELRGSNNATVKDIVDQRRWIAAQNQKVKSFIEEIHQSTFESATQMQDCRTTDGRRVPVQHSAELAPYGAPCAQTDAPVSKRGGLLAITSVVTTKPEETNKEKSMELDEV